MPNHGTAITIKMAACGIAPSARTKKIHTRTTKIEIGMIIHTIASGRPQGKGIVSIGPYITVDDDGTSGTSKNRHLMDGRIFNGSSVIVVNSQSANNTIIRTFLQHNDTIAYRTSMIFRDGTCLAVSAKTIRVLSRFSPTKTILGLSIITF